MSFNRRDFLRTAAPLSAVAMGFLGSTDAPLLLAQSYGGTAAARGPAAAPMTEKTVALSGDAAPVSNQQRVEQLARLLAKDDKAADSYLANGAVAELEQHVARILGKEEAVFMPTGTLANNLAVRVLCGEHKHAIVQHESHLYQDESDAASILSGLNLVPMAVGKAAPTYEEVVATIDVAEKSPYPIKVGAISIESPVRRANGESVPFALVEKIAALAKQKGIGMHLDGARLMLLSGTPGFALESYCAPFDTVYVSLYKYLGAPFGAILAGKKETIAQARELRHIYGGLIYHGWMSALPALDAVQGFPARFAEVRQAGEKLLATLVAAGGFEVERVPNESNIVFLTISPEREKGLKERLDKADIRARRPESGRMQLAFNESLLRQSPETLAKAFLG